MNKQITIETPSDTTVVITRTFAAPQRTIFEMWTKCEHLKKWMLGPGDWVITDCNPWDTPGEKWSITWDKQGGGVPMTLSGKCLSFDPFSSIRVTENWGEPWPETINRTEFIEAGGATDVAITITYPSKEARDAAMQTGMADGLEVSYARLDALIKQTE